MKNGILFANFCLILTGCTPRVQLETPQEGITINMNVVIDHKIDIKMDEQSKAIITTSDTETKSSSEKNGQ